ncbi:hypothetical protein G6F35_017811 [Rhizopus arrhizus]|nr:hypothetical protein G6F35_017811 [Rhizopus arrhizus]
MCSWRHTGQQPVDLGGMREAEQQFVHDLGRADGARQRDQPGIRRVAVDEMVLVEARQLLVAHAARHRRDMVHCLSHKAE